MLTALLKTVFSPKVRLRIILRGAVYNNSFHLKVVDIIRRHGMMGMLRATPNVSLNIEIEGHKPKVEECLEAIRELAARNPIEKMELSWMEYQGKFNRFTANL